MKKCKINTQLLPIKAHYFLWYAATAGVHSYMGVYAKQLGFSSFAVGLIFTLIPLLKMVLAPMIGAVADKYKNQKMMFLVIQVMGACSFVCLIFLPQLPIYHRVNFTCDGNGSFINIPDAPPCAYRLLSETAGDTINCNVLCSSMPNKDILEDNAFYTTIQTNTLQYEDRNLRLLDASTQVHRNCSKVAGINNQCDAFCDALALNEMIAKPKVLGTDIIHHYQLWLLLFVYFGCMFAHALACNFGDTICLQILGPENRQKYGFQRIFASLGWGAFAFISGSLIDFYSVGKVRKDYTLALGVAAGLKLLSVVVSYNIKYTQQPHKAHLLKDMTKCIRQPNVLLFMIWCAFVGLFTGTWLGFYFWLLEDLANIKGCDVVRKIKTIEGLSLTVQSLLGQLPFYFCSGWIFKKLSYTNGMTLVVFISGINLILVSCISNPWWSLPISVLSGANVGLYYSVIVSYASVVAPRGVETTTQAMATSSVYVGSSLGGFFGGLLVGAVGSALSFRIFGIGSLIFCVIHAVAKYLINKFESREIGKYTEVKLVDNNHGIDQSVD